MNNILNFLLLLFLPFSHIFLFLCFVRSKCDREKMFEMCFQSKTLYRKFAVTPREVWNVFTVPFLPGLFHTFLLWRARSHLPLTVAIVMPWTSLWESSEKTPLLWPECWPTHWPQDGFTNVNPTYLLWLKKSWWAIEIYECKPEVQWLRCSFIRQYFCH